MISNNAYYELFASYTVPDHNRVGYWVDLGANSKGKVIKTYNENLKKWVKVTDATSEDAVAPFIGNNGNWWIDNRDTGINASGHSPYIGDNSNWFVYSSERNEHIDTGLPSRGEAGPKGDKGDKGKDATINGVGSIKIEAGDNITITQSDDTLTIIGDVQKPDLSNYATKTEVTKLDNKLQDAVSSVFRAKGSVKTYNNLPVDKVSIGDVYNVLDTGANYVAISINPITWDKLSETVDLSKFFNKNEIDSLLSTKVDKQEGKQLTTEDFTTVLKRKLEGLSNYNDTEIRNAIDSLESAFNTLVEGNATVAIDTFNEIVAFLKNVENSQDLDSIIAGINTTISKVEAKIPDTNNFLSKDGGTMNNTNLVGNLNAELLNGYSSDKFVSIINHIKDSTTTDALTVGLNTINQDYLWTNTPYSDIATLVDMSYSPDWRSLFFISPSTQKIHTRFKYDGDAWSNWKEIAFTDGTIEFAKKFVPRYITNLSTDGINEFFSSGFQPNNRPSNNNYATGFTVYNSELAHTYQFAFGTYGDVHTRYKTSTEWQPWRRLAFSDDPVAAANKLSTTRYLWGQSFDGSGDVYGDLKSIDGYNFVSTTSNHVLFGYGYAQNNKTMYLDGSPIYFRYGTNHKVGMILNSYGNVTIGEGDFASSNYKLYVNGNVYHNGMVSTNNLIRLYGKTNVSSDVYLDNTTYDGLNIRTGSSSRMLIGSKVGIGVDYPTHKLHINGSIKAEYNPDYDLAHTLIGETHFYNDSYSDPATNIKAAIKVNGVIAQSSGNVLLCTTSGNVGINTTTPRGTLDVNGSSVIDGYVYLKGVNRRIYFYNSEGEGLLIDNNGINWHDAKDSFAFNIMAFSSNKRVGINTTMPQEALDVNGSAIIRDSFHTLGYIFLDGTNQINGTQSGIALNYNCGKYVNTTIYNGTGSLIASFIGESRRVGIKTSTPEATLDVNGDSVFRNHIYVKKYHRIFMNTGEEGVYYTDDGLYWHNANNEYVRYLIKFNNDGDASFTGGINLDGSDQINGIHGIALNYNCGKYVNTDIWNGQKKQIMKVFGEASQVAIGVNAIESPQGRLNVDGDVVFENSRFITTSGFTGGDYSYSHAIYGGYHGINVCEFYEDEFRFKGNGGITTLLTLNRYEATFNGTVTSLNCNFTGTWNSRERFRLNRDGEFNTWLQAGTDTTNDNGRLYMSGLNGALLHQFNVWATTSNFKGSIIAEGDVTAYSDIRLKNRIESVNNVLDTINTLDVFRYTWKDREDKSVHIGVSAQQVQTIYPEFVLTSNSEDGTDYLTVNYAALATCIAIQGIKELVKKGDERDKRIAALEEEVISLKEQLRYGNK